MSDTTSKTPQRARLKAIIRALQVDGPKLGLQPEHIHELLTEIDAERKLRASEERFRFLADNARDVIFRYEFLPQPHYAYISPAVLAMTGHTPEEFYADPDLMLRLAHPEDREQLETIMRGEQSLPPGAIVRFIRKDGAVVWTEQHYTPVHDDTGRIVAVEGICNVSRRTQAEAALRQSERRLREIADTIPVLVWSARPDGVADYYNGPFLSYLGKTHEQVTGSVWASMLHPDDVPATADAWAKAVQTGSAYEMEARILRASDGSYRWHLIRAMPLRDAQHWIIRWYGTCTDIEDRKRAEGQLRESRDRLALALEAGQAGSSYWDSRSNKVTWDGRHYEMFGYEPGSFAPTFTSWRERVHPEDVERIASAVDQCFRQKEGKFEGEHRIIWPNGEIRWIHTCGRFSYGADGRPASMMFVVLDITDLRRAKDDAEAASRAKDRFLAVLSHELRTPLTPVLTTVQLMERDASLRPSVRESIATIRRNVELEARLIDDLLDLTRVSRGKLELNIATVDLHEKLRQVIQICDSDIRSRQLELTATLNAADHSVQADAARIQQVLWNLLKNAVKFTPVGGQIRLRTENTSNGRISVTVSDTGIGIEPHLLPRLFDAFEQGGKDVTRQYGGLGLGLSISKGLVDLHGGTLTAQSEGRGKGATFTLELRTSMPQAPAVSNDHTAQIPPKREGGRILLVEDHADTARTLSALLKSCGYEVRVAGSVASALRAADAERFDLLISDIGLPDGSGLDLMRQLGAKYPVRGIAMSGYGMDEDIRMSREAGFHLHLTKPLDLARLDEAIQQLCAED